MRSATAYRTVHAPSSPTPKEAKLSTDGGSRAMRNAYLPWKVSSGSSASPCWAWTWASSTSWPGRSNRTSSRPRRTLDAVPVQQVAPMSPKGRQRLHHSLRNNTSFLNTRIETINTRRHEGYSFRSKKPNAVGYHGTKRYGGKEKTENINWSKTKIHLVTIWTQMYLASSESERRVEGEPRK